MYVWFQFVPSSIVYVKLIRATDIWASWVLLGVRAKRSEYSYYIEENLDEASLSAQSVIYNDPEVSLAKQGSARLRIPSLSRQ